MYPGEVEWFDEQLEIWAKSEPPVDRDGLVEKLRIASDELKIPPNEFDDYITSIDERLAEHQIIFDDYRNN